MIARRLLAATGLAAALAASLAPFLWFAAISFETPVGITGTPSGFWPSGTLDAYRSVLFEHDLARTFANSLVVAGATTVATLAIATGAAYALARLELRFRRVVLAAVLATAMFPQVAIAGPVWRILRDLGLLNTWPGLVLPHVSLTLPLAIWLLASFFRDLPREVEEAALVDGATRLGALVRVVLPLAAPAVFTAGILVFIYSWNEFFFALLILSDPTRHTLPLGIALFPGRYVVPWGEIAAASVLATLPLIVVVLAFERRIASGLVAGAVKG